MPRTKEQFDEMRQATREKIQDAASYLFARKGVAGTGVQEIADRAGISIGLLYRHYKTKEDLFNELVDMASAGLCEITELLLSDGEPREILASITEEIISDFKKSDEFEDFLTFITQALVSGIESDSLKALLEQDKKLIDAMAQLVEKGQRSGSFHGGNPKELAGVYMSAVQGIGLFKSVMKEDFTLPSSKTLLSIISSRE